MRNRYFPAKIEQTKVRDFKGRSVEVCTLYMGKGQIPHVYTRPKLSIKDILRGRRATLPWSRVWIR